MYSLARIEVGKLMSSDSELPKYVTHAGDPSRLQPFELANCTLWGWILQGNQQCLQDLCDKNLNTPRLKEGETLQYQKDYGSYFQAIGDLVFLIYDTNNDVQGRKSPSMPVKPIYKEPNELFFCFPCVYDKNGSSPSIYYHMPFCYVGDSDPAIITGREVYGFPKAWADFTFPKGAITRSNELESIMMSSQWTFVKQDEPEERVKTRDLIKIKKTGDKPPEPLKLLEKLMKDVDAALIKSLFDFLDPESRINYVNLKQFRDVEDGTRACYQAIVAAPFVASDLHLKEVSLQGEYEIVIFKDIASHPHVEALGLQGDDLTEPDGSRSISIKQTACINIDFDLELKPGKLIWRST